jgi:high-affinity K+ transport system ATPase subunit B
MKTVKMEIIVFEKESFYKLVDELIEGVTRNQKPNEITRVAGAVDDWSLVSLESIFGIVGVVFWSFGGETGAVEVME